MRQASFDVIVIGSGAAGLRAALSVRAAGLSVCVVSKASPGKSTCTWFSAGVMAGSAGADIRHTHLQRTLAAGRGLNEAILAGILVEEAPLRIDELIRWGIHADVINGYLYAKGRPPVLGEEIVRCLLRRNEALGTCLWGNLVVTDVLAGNDVAGVNAYEKSSGEWVVLTAGAVIIATGGASALYLRTDNPRRILGDGYRLAIEAGAMLQDMEFVQFYPLCLSDPGTTPLVIPPRIADRGRLINDDKEDILEKYGITERPAGERARDLLSQALFKEIYRNHKNVWLDLRNLSEDDWRVDPFAASLRGLLCKRHGAGERPLRVAPAAHHSMGGAKIDATGATSVPGLFAAGEAAGGLHGANRMGGNALSETLVFGARAGSAAAAWVNRSGGGSRQDLLKELGERARKWSYGTPVGGELKDRLRKIMWEDGGIIREEKGLSRALGAVKEIQNEASASSSKSELYGKELLDSIELRSAARVATLILEAALMRRESRGAHFREDFPGQNDAQWQGHLQVHLTPGGENVWQFEPIPKGDGSMAAGPIEPARPLLEKRGQP
ncbi:MAG TPA: FAD-binding protein [Desulfobacterales bacterium]|nr:FAD-binding protein [Desulfobacterales bacterium]